MKKNAAVVGQRLRRYLGALLAVGFGATWWGLVPATKADAAPVAHVAIAKRPVVVAHPPVAAVTRVPTIRLPHVPRPVKPRRTHHVFALPPPPVTPVTIVHDDVVPVVAPVVVPVVDPVPVPEPIVDEPVLPHIRTRSS